MQPVPEGGLATLTLVGVVVVLALAVADHLARLMADPRDAARAAATPVVSAPKAGPGGEVTADDLTGDEEADPSARSGSGSVRSGEEASDLRGACTDLFRPNAFAVVELETLGRWWTPPAIPEIGQMTFIVD